MPTFMVDGYVAGSWKYEKGRVRLGSPSGESRLVRKAMNEEAERLAALHSKVAMGAIGRLIAMCASGGLR